MNRIRGLFALLALVALLGGVPWLLLHYGNWPITGMPDAEWLNRLTNTVLSDSTIFSALTVGAWLVWGIFAISVLIEMGAALRGMEAPKLSLGGPLQRLAGGLVAAVVLAVSINQAASQAAVTLPSGYVPARSVPISATVPPAAPMTTLLTRAAAPSVPGSSAPASGHVAVVPPAEISSSAASNVVTVRRNDSAWAIAEEHLGDGMRWRELWELNKGVVQRDGRAWTDPKLLLEGWLVRLPTDASAATPVVGHRTPSESPETYVVVRGDTLSEIASEELGDPTRFPEIFEASKSIEQPGGRYLHDPNLILPGWTLVIPDEATLPPEPPASEAPATPPPPVVVEKPAPPASADPPVATEAPTTSTLPPPTTTPTSTMPPTTTAVPATASIPSVSVVPSASTDNSASGRSAALVAAVGGSLALASGLSIRLAMLRRRRGIRNARRIGAAESKAADIATVVRAADVPLLRWAGQEVAVMVDRLDPRRLTAEPLAVEISEEVGIEVLWSSSQQQPAPDGWQVRDGGASWRHSYDPNAPTPPNEHPAAIPALVTVGRRDGRQLLVDLEAFGTVAVTGPDEMVESFLCALAVELSVSEEVSDAWVQVSGVDLPGGPYDRSKFATPDAAVAAVSSAAASVRASLESASVTDTFRARAGHPMPIEANIAILRSLPEGSTFDVSPRSGAAVIVGGQFEGARCTIDLRSDGTARIEPLRIVFEPVGLDVEAAEALDEVVDELIELAVIEHHPADVEPVESSAMVAQFTFDEVGEEPPSSEGSDHELLVKVLGVPSIPDRPDIGRRDIVIAAILACRGGPVATSYVQDCVWKGEPISQKTVWNVIGIARDALGFFADGTKVMLPSDRTQTRLMLDPRVTTDLALVRAAVTDAKQASSAEAIELLRAALDLVEGPPFDAPDYDWAYTEQLVTEASSLIEEGTGLLVDLALEAGLVDVCRTVIRRAMRAIPDTESLYRCLMRVEHATGNSAGVRQAFRELTTALKEIDAEPSEESVRLHRSLRPSGGEEQTDSAA